MNKRNLVSILVVTLVIGGIIGFNAVNGTSEKTAQNQINGNDENDPILSNADRLALEGREIFRDDTFGDEAFWGDKLQLHKAIEGEKFGGIGTGVSPITALDVGLKVDVDKLPEELVNEIEQGKVNLSDPATTLALIKLNAVIGVKGQFNENGTLKTIGITCALCHTVVDNSLTFGIGHRLDGWANRDINAGAIINLSPNLSPIADLLGTNEATVRTVLK